MHSVTRSLPGSRADEHLFCNLGAESSDFVRLNHNRIRQAGSVRSAGLGLNLIDGARQAEAACDLSGDLDGGPGARPSPAGAAARAHRASTR